jgi:hypothetical protein
MNAARKIDRDEVGPMNPDLLAKMRRWVEGGQVWLVKIDEVEALLADRDHHEQKAKALEERVRQLEERCAIDAEDIREHRVTRAQVEAWAADHGWSRVIRARITDERGATWWERAGKRDIQVREGASSLAYNIDEFAVADSRNAWDVLREMAAIQVPGTTN